MNTHTHYRNLGLVAHVFPEGAVYCRQKRESGYSGIRKRRFLEFFSDTKWGDVNSNNGELDVQYLSNQCSVVTGPTKVGIGQM